jgi:hypothetical protein
LVEERCVHNVWTDIGRIYLAYMVGEVGPAMSPMTERTDRIKYLGLGVGGVYQDPSSLISPVVDAYPVGYAERRWPPDYAYDGGTTGDEYDQLDPTSPRIRTLERPVRRTGALSPYPGAASDRWYVEPPNLYVTHLTLQETTIHALVDATAGDYIIGALTTLPVTEAGLFTSLVSPSGIAYQQLVAYVNFGTIVLSASSKLEFIWRVRFG